MLITWKNLVLFRARHSSVFTQINLEVLGSYENNKKAAVQGPN